MPSVTVVGEVTVIAAPAEQGLGVALAEVAGEPRPWPGLGRRAPGAFRLVVLPDAAALSRWSGGRAPRWGAALTLPRARTVLLRADADPLQTFQHELAHLVLNDAIRSRVPLWFDEGYAVWAAGEWDLTRQLALNLAVSTTATPSLDTLSLALRGDEVGVAAAYALAASAVLELARRHPSGSIAPLLERLGAGEAFGDAVLATTGLPLDRFDDAWRRSVRRRYSVFTWLFAGGAWAVLGL
ncbi:MAG: peptidase MA family metallohydrolase, partial [Gemmatimonadales bacterium]|nr:peptidase MA family metallohydrolase [Gemmatimonadales bacterium]